ncbi:STAS domain-containing protein [Streptomyces sp. NPDC086554]|uniref:STAS domain-containing protein n=1 Tax=Streptomyces sp. NPDC086554 TaxID=3154864 RepID=UPI00343247EC
MTIHQDNSGDVRFLRLKLTGELDNTNISTLCDAIVSAFEQGDSHLRMDLSGVTWCDHASLYALLGIRHALSNIGGSLALSATSSCVQAALTRTGLDQFFLPVPADGLRSPPEPRKPPTDTP